jgi:hypothetical protein
MLIIVLVSKTLSSVLTPTLPHPSAQHSSATATYVLAITSEPGLASATPTNPGTGIAKPTKQQQQQVDSQCPS